MFLERVTALYQAQGITKNKLLTDLRLDKSSFFNWEKRGTIPSGDVVARLADYFHVSTDYLLGRTGNPRPVEESAPDAPAPAGGPPGYDALPPGKRAVVDQLVALLKQEEEASGAAPFPVAAVAQGGGEYQTQADAGITLPKDSTRVLSGQDRAETGGAAGAPAER